MIPYEDVNLQLVDLPPITGEYTVSWIVNALQPADAALLVVDVGTPECLDLLGGLMSALASRERSASCPNGSGTGSRGGCREWRGDRGPVRDSGFRPALVAARADESPDAEEELEVLQDLLEIRYPAMAVSARTGAGLEVLAKWLFESLEVVRVYTKAPGRPPDYGQPFTVRRGDTVHDVARMVHKEIAESLRFGRLWRSGATNGRQVGRDFCVADRDVLELVTGPGMIGARSESPDGPVWISPPMPEGVRPIVRFGPGTLRPSSAGPPRQCNAVHAGTRIRIQWHGA